MNNNAGWATEQNIARMTALYNAGHGAKGIGERMGLSKGTIAGMLNRLNLRRDDPLINAPHATEFWTGAAPAWNTPDADGLFALMWDKGVRTNEMQEFFGITQEQRRSARGRLQLAPRDPKTSVRRRVETREAAVKPKPLVDRPIASTRAIGRSGVQTIGSIDWHAVNLCPKPVWRAGQCRWPLRCEEPATGRFCTEHMGLLARKVA